MGIPRICIYVSAGGCAYLRRRIRAGKGMDVSPDLFKDNHVYVACQTGRHPVRA